MKSTALTALMIFLLVQSIPVAAHAGGTEKVTVERIVFHGNTVYDDGELRDLMSVRTSGFLRRSFYDPRVFQDDLENIRKFHVENGYLDARIEKVVIDSTGNRFRIDITVFEGELTRVEDVLLTGNTVFTAPYLLKDIPLKPGEPFKGTQVSDAIGTIMHRYGLKGYITVAVNPDIRINHDLHRVIVDFTIIEGEQYHIAGIDIQGMKKTRSSVVRRELRFREGQIINYSRLLRSERALYGTGLFNTVLIQPEPAPDDSTGRIVSVKLRERKTGEFGVGVGYETVDGFRGTLAVQNKSFLGTGRRVGLNSQVSQISRNGRFFWSNPWTFGLRVRSDANALVEYRKEPGYDLRRIGGNVVLGKTLRRHTDAGIMYRFESIKISRIKSDEIPDKLKKGNLRSLIFTVTYDSRDDLFNTRRGSYLEVRNALVGNFIGGTDNYVTSSLTGRRFFPVNRKVVVGTALQFGWQGMFNTTREIPLSERFYTGGPNTLRGFEYQKAGPLDDERVPLGGRLLLAGNLEMRAEVYRMLGFAVFFDAGNVWQGAGDFRFGSIRTDAGFGPRVNTPVGVIRADFAFKLDRKRGERLNQFYIAFGHAF